MLHPIRFPVVAAGLLLVGVLGSITLNGADNASSASPQKATSVLPVHPAGQPIPAPWLDAEAKKLSKTDVSVDALRATVRQELSRAATRPAAGDIENMVLVILQKASADTEADLRAMTAQMKATAERKAAQRDAAKDKKDALAEMNQQDQLKLQMLMERRAKLVETISQIMKKSPTPPTGWSAI